MLNSPITMLLFLIVMTTLTWGGLWRQLRWLHYDPNDNLTRPERTILQRQIIAMAAYFPIHLIAVVLPIADPLRGGSSLIASLLLVYLGLSAIRHRCLVSFNRQTRKDNPAIREKNAVAAGSIMLFLSVIISGIGFYLLA